MFSGHKTASDMTKSNFSQTCNRLSQFLREKRSYGDHFAFQNMASSKLDLMKGAKANYGLNNNLEKERNASSEENHLKSLDLFPLKSSSATGSEESTKNMADWREMPSNEQAKTTNRSTMTIFYGGKVLVFDELTEDKAQEIMSVASQGVKTSSQTNTTTTLLNPTSDETLRLAPARLSDLPLARRVSLHRFMEKRKDRIASTSAPYQLQHPEKNNLFRNLGQQQQEQLELKFL